jgi:hypothetical protein
MPRLTDCPQLDRGRKAYRITRTYRGIGRIRVSAGTNQLSTYARLLTMLDELYSMPERWHLLSALQRGEIAPLQLYRFYKTQDLARAPSPSSVTPLMPHIFDWLAAGGRAERTTRVYAEQFRVLLREGSTNARVSDLYDLLAAYRLRCLSRERATFRSFNLCRAAVLSYLRFGFRDQRALWREIAEQIRPFAREWRQRPPHHLTVGELVALLPKFSLKYREVVWTLFTTGMRISEYTEEGACHWTALPDRIHVAGSKTPAANRVIPRIDCPVKNRIHGRSCAQVVSRVTERQYEPRDLRRSYARLLADAGIPEYRQAAYMGHAARTMTLHYQIGGIEPFLHEDAARIRELIARA